MDHRSTRWITVTDSPYPRKRTALDHIRIHLPDHPPFLAMSNFEFVAGDYGTPIKSTHQKQRLRDTHQLLSTVTGGDL